jgi:transposase
VFKSLYLFGAFSPITGDHFLLEMPYCNSQTFQLFLDAFALVNPTELKMMVLDNGAFHKAKALSIPENIVLIFLPPYSPELNPAENIWAKFKRDFTNRVFKILDDLGQYICTLANRLTKNEVRSTCRFPYIFLDNFWTKL